MVSLSIEPYSAKRNIKFLNRIKSELREFFPNTDSLSFLNILEGIVFSKNLTKKQLELKLGIKLTDVEFKRIFTPHWDEIYPNEEQSLFFVEEVGSLVNLNQEEKKILKNRFIHLWQIPRSEDIPSFNSLLNIINLFKDSSVDEELLIKLNSLLDKKAA